MGQPPPGERLNQSRRPLSQTSRTPNHNHRLLGGSKESITERSATGADRNGSYVCTRRRLAFDILVVVPNGWLRPNQVNLSQVDKACFGSGHHTGLKEEKLARTIEQSQWLLALPYFGQSMRITGDRYRSSPNPGVPHRTHRA